MLRFGMVSWLVINLTLKVDKDALIGTMGSQAGLTSGRLSLSQ